MVLKLPALLGNNDRHNQQTDRRAYQLREREGIRKVGRKRGRPDKSRKREGIWEEGKRKEGKIKEG